MDTPRLTKNGLVTAFKCVEKVEMKNGGELEGVKVLKELLAKNREEERRRREEAEREAEERRAADEASKKTVVVATKNEWIALDKRIGILVVGDNCCNESAISALDMSVYVYLREWRVGNDCFENVNELRIVGVKELESVAIGMNSFTKVKNDGAYNSDRHFYLKDCPKMKSLKTGQYSFSDYGVCEIESMDGLEAIEMGELEKDSYCFVASTIELKGSSVRVQ